MSGSCGRGSVRSPMRTWRRSRRGLGDDRDREAETFLESALRAVRPDLPVVGEEAVAADPSVLDVLYPGGSCWLVDPVDGTGNFVRGDPAYGMAIALVERGEAVASWIWQPEFGVGWQAEAGAGTYRNGERVRVGPTAVDACRSCAACSTPGSSRRSSTP